MRIPPPPPAVAPNAPEPHVERKPPPIAGNVAWRLVGTTSRIAIAILSVPLYTRIVGMSQWGLLMLFQAAAAPMALLDLGISAAVVQRVSLSLGRGDRAAALRTTRAALFFNGIMLAIGASILLGLSPWFARSAFAIEPALVPVAIRGFGLVAISWAATASLSFCSNLLIATQRYDQVVRASTVSILASTAAGLAAAAATRDASWVLAAQAGGTLLGGALAFRQVHRLMPGLHRRVRWDPPELRRLLNFGAPQTMANMGAILSGWSDRYVLGVSFAPRIVGFYAIAQSLQQQLYAVFFEAGEVLFPAVSHRHGAGDESGARRLALLSGWALTTGFGPAAITLATVGGDFLSLWISPEAASEATTVLRLLAVAGIAGLAGVAPIFYAMGTGRSFWQAPFALAMGLLFAIASVVLAPRFGLPGIGAAMLAAQGVRWLLLLLLWRALFRPAVKPGEFVLHVFAPPIASVVLLVISVIVHDAVAPTVGWLGLVIEAALVLVVAAAAQLGIGEIFPGGSERRLDVIRSFRPVASRALARLQRPE